MENNTTQQVIDPLFLKSENEILQNYINGELSKNNFDIKKESLSHLEKKKLTATLISAPINLILIIVFRVFHYSQFWLILLIIINFLIWRKFTKAPVTDFFIKEIKSRPDENFSDVIAPQLYDRCKNGKLLRAGIFILCTFLIPMLMFLKPHVFYEDYQNEKYVRFYTEGLMSEANLIIPDEVDGKKVVGLRGDVFNSTDLVSVTLPDAIDTIRGHAFEDCEYLETVNMPKKLKYIGGYAFNNCKKLKEVHLPKQIGEIHGYTFANCQNLRIVEFEEPSSVTRIGGHAFQNTALMEIKIPESVTEIGSSAFRDCRYLSKAYVPENCMMNERAFKNSPTTITKY